MVIFVYPSRWAKLRRKDTSAAVVTCPNVPAKLGVNEMWHGLMLYEKNTTEARGKGHLYVGVITSHSNRYFLLRVPKRKPEPDIPKNSVASG